MRTTEGRSGGPDPAREGTTATPEREHRPREAGPEDTTEESLQDTQTPPADRQPVEARERADRDGAEASQEERAPAEPEDTTREETRAAEGTPGRKMSPWVRRLALLALLMAVVIGAILGLRYWRHASTHVSTDDAYVTTDVVQITPQEAGSIAQVLVDDNQQVNAGQLLVLLDDTTFRDSVQQAEASLAVAKAQAAGAASNVGLTTRTASAQITQARAAVAQAVDAIRVAQDAVLAAQAQAVKAGRDEARYAELYREKAVSAQEADAMHAAAVAARAQLRSAQQQVAQAEANRVHAEGQLQQALTAPQQVAVSQANQKTANAQVRAAQAALDNARIVLQRTRIVAPVAGTIGQKNAEVGQQVSVGQPIMAVVPNNDAWVLANFQETQLKGVRPGQRAEVRADAIPGRTFTGRVQSLAPATGATFALLPPNNATGNFTKVVQRVPVKIVFDPNQKDLNRLRGGLSVTATIALR